MLNHRITQTVIEDVIKEREKQDLKWGTNHDSKHSVHDWMALITYELAQMTFENLDSVYEKAIKVASLSVAMAEVINFHVEDE